MPRFAVTTLGCKVNQYESSAVCQTLTRTGLEPAARPPDPSGPPPDLVVVNTCCITRTAMRKSRQAIRRAVRGAPSAAVMVIGCYSDYGAGVIHRLLASLSVPPDRAIVVGHHGDVARCAKKAAKLLTGPGHPGPARRRQAATSADAGRDDLPMTGMSATDPSRHAHKLCSITTRRQLAVKNNSPGTRGCGPIQRFGDRQRAFVKIQDGCDAFCSYCIVPYTRPNLWWRDADEIEAECRALSAAGHKEIVLCGVHLGAFGRSTAVRRRWAARPGRLSGLVDRIARIEGLWRVRLSSLCPADVTEDLLAVCRANSKIAPHFHLPLQSGSDRVLRRMNRQYTARQYLETIRRLRRALDRPAVTADIIVGFPSESEQDFAETLDVARRAQLARIHVFPFSPIEGTAAWAWRREMPPAEVVRRRTSALAELQGHLGRAYRRQFVGETLEGLVEKPRTNSAPLRQAMTDRYMTVHFRHTPTGGTGTTKDPLTGSVVRLKIQDVTDNGLLGAVAN